jgi:hypothetical protein
MLAAPPNDKQDSSTTDKVGTDGSWST